MEDTEKKQEKEAEKEKLFTQAEVNKIVAERLARKKEEDARAREQAENEAAKERELAEREAAIAAREARMAEKEREEELYYYALGKLSSKELPEEFAGIIDKSSEESIDGAVDCLNRFVDQMMLEFKAAANGGKWTISNPIMSPDEDEKTKSNGKVDNLLRDLFGLNQKGK